MQIDYRICAATAGFLTLAVVLSISMVAGANLSASVVIALAAALLSSAAWLRMFQMLAVKAQAKKTSIPPQTSVK